MSEIGRILLVGAIHVSLLARHGSAALLLVGIAIGLYPIVKTARTARPSMNLYPGGLLGVSVGKTCPR